MRNLSTIALYGILLYSRSTTESEEKMLRMCERSFTIIIEIKIIKIDTWGCGPAVEGICSLSLHQASSFTVHACHPRGVLHAHWACKIFSGSED